MEPATKREFFHASKYSDIVGVITTSAVNASCSVGCHSLAALSRSDALVAKSFAAATRKSASGSASPNSTLPSPSRSGVTPLAANFSSVPHSEVSSRKKKLPGCSNVLPAGVLTENGTAFSGSDLSAPASMITSKSASEGTPATTPSICS